MNKPPAWFTVIAVLALLWNLLGCFAFWSDLRMTPDDVAKLDAAQRQLYDLRPAWAQVATGLAVIAGALGCVALLMRTAWASTLFVISLVGLVVQDFGLFVLAGGAKLAGPVPLVLQGLVLVIAIGLWLLARKAIARGWIA